jgi:hypothetical protein
LSSLSSLAGLGVDLVSDGEGFISALGFVAALVGVSGLAGDLNLEASLVDGLALLDFTLIGRLSLLPGGDLLLGLLDDGDFLVDCSSSSSSL